MSLFVVYSIFIKTLLESKQGQYIVLNQGASAPAFVMQLKERGLIQYPRFVLGLIKWRGDAQHLHAGEYFISPTMSLWQLLNQVAIGKVALHSLKIIEGWTFHQMMEAVAANPYLTHEVAGLSDTVIMQKLGYPHELPEGRFFPNTYLFSLGTKDAKILKQAYALMDTLLTREWRSRDLALPYNTMYEALIAASLLEKEASRVDERDIISGIIIRRLETHMALQFDSTVIYGLGSHFSGSLRSVDLTSPSPFNTYRHRSLPPTPIALPGLSSIRAALHPLAGKAMYYVAKNKFEHYFSDSLEEHHRAVALYQRH